MDRYTRYIHERFPLFQTLPMAVLFGLSIAVTAPTLVALPVQIHAIALVIIALFLFLLRLRLLDDVKDFAHDTQYHPERPAQRGVITRNELVYGAIGIIVVETVIASIGGMYAFIAFCVTTGYSVALFGEALYRDTLRQHFTLYIGIHEFLLVPLLVYLMLLSGVEWVHLWAFPLVTLGICVGMLFFLLEVVRKVRAPEDETAGHDTYTDQYGVCGSAVLVGIVATCAYVTFGIVLSFLSAHFLAGVVLAGIVLAWMLYGVYRFTRQPTRHTAWHVFMTGALYAAALLIGIIGYTLV